MNRAVRSQGLFVLGSWVTGLTMRVPRFPVLGETLRGDELNFGPGGKGFNQALAAARLGAKVEIVLAVGKDILGDYARSAVAASGFSRVHWVESDRSTGVGFVTLLPSGENSICIHAGANESLGASDLVDLREAIADSGRVLATLETPLGAFGELLAIAEEAGIAVQLNPAPAHALRQEMLSKVDLLTPNETEARLLLGLAPSDETSAEELAERLLESGVARVLITCGAAGVVVADGNATWRMVAPRIDPVDTTGCGDAFNGALAAGLLEGRKFEDAVKRAIFAGAFCATRLGVVDGLPDSETLELFMEKNDEIVDCRKS
jgi:ribokinase